MQAIMRRRAAYVNAVRRRGYFKPAAIARIRSAVSSSAGKERLQRQFRQRDVDRRAEDHGGRDEAQDLAVSRSLKGIATLSADSGARARRHRIGLQLG